MLVVDKAHRGAGIGEQGEEACFFVQGARAVLCCALCFVHASLNHTQS
jgi:hypothetical protein